MTEPAVLSQIRGDHPVSSTDQAASATLAGLPAILLILVILALIVIGIVAVVRAAKRKAGGK